MSLLNFYHGHDVEDDVRKVLAARGLPHATLAECQAWARKFVQERVPEWRPRQPLTFEQARRVGESFLAALRVAREGDVIV